jgi:hypothetical protein
MAAGGWLDLLPMLSEPVGVAGMATKHGSQEGTCADEDDVPDDWWQEAGHHDDPHRDQPREDRPPPPGPNALAADVLANWTVKVRVACTSRAHNRDDFTTHLVRQEASAAAVEGLPVRLEWVARRRR